MAFGTSDIGSTTSALLAEFILEHLPGLKRSDGERRLLAGSCLFPMTTSGAQTRSDLKSHAEVLLEVSIEAILNGLRGLLRLEDLSDIPNWTAHT